jgi:tetratricopeptide (TPR) repeat protein
MIARLLAVAVVLLVASSAPARAESHAQREARDHYYRGMTHYDLAEYDRAIDEFKQAYELSHEPALLFNLAQASRLKKDYEAALHFYETYLMLVPKAPNRADAETQLAHMKELVAEDAAARDAAAKEAAAKAATPPPPMPVVALELKPPSFFSTTRGRVTLVVASLGAAALIASAVTGGLSLADRSRYDQGCNAGHCDPALYSSGRGLAIGTDVLISVGVAAAVTTLVLVLTRPRARRLALALAF